VFQLEKCEVIFQFENGEGPLPLCTILFFCEQRGDFLKGSESAHMTLQFIVYFTNMSNIHSILGMDEVFKVTQHDQIVGPMWQTVLNNVQENNCREKCPVNQDIMS
jgi:hypothetical protein